MNYCKHNTPSGSRALEEHEFSLRGYCRNCQLEHHLPAGKAVQYCHELMDALERHGTLGLYSDVEDPQYCTAPLFGEARGKMLGVLEGIDPWGQSVVLKAFSGQFNSLWTIPGWAPPLFCENTWRSVNTPCEGEIKELTAKLAVESHSPEKLQILRQERKKRSQVLMRKLHSLYTVRNFQGDKANLSDFYTSMPAPPAGAGDCCAPKLLNLAQKMNILPRSIAEFYWGRTNRSNTRHHGKFYPSCSDKCGPLIGFMLCGHEKIIS